MRLFPLIQRYVNSSSIFIYISFSFLTAENDLFKWIFYVYNKPNDNELVADPLVLRSKKLASAAPYTWES